ncbi:hypothetical protein NQ314_012766 [Rhamnusium bicolor]|uniref:Uncharacterized protein n=1 Tax=Rhamnusium bicolor TaxID=1586634 RepID=A0AAV8XAP1_9CUCU|nr:hypothetical protein NQ314_012766 [Rhamnusium bicolor]
MEMTRKKARLAIESLRKTGGRSYDTDQLTELEIRLMNICGWVSVLGCDELPEEIDPDLPENNNAEFNNNDEEMKISECKVAENGNLTIAQDEDIPITETRTGKSFFILTNIIKIGHIFYFALINYLFFIFRKKLF